MSYFLIIAVLLTVESSSAQLDGDPPPLLVAGKNIIKHIELPYHVFTYCRSEVVSW